MNSSCENAGNARTSRCSPGRAVDLVLVRCDGLTRLNQQVLRWTSWHRWTTLSMLAHAFLAVATVDQRDTHPTPVGLITLTINEFRRLFDILLPTTRRTTTSLLE